MPRVTTLKADHQKWAPPRLLEHWRQDLQEHDHAPGTVKKYTQAVSHFLVWYEQEEHAPFQLATLTPIALIGYRNELQQHLDQQRILNLCVKDGFRIDENTVLLPEQGGVQGSIKNLIFAANGPKPEIVLADAINNDIRIVKNEQYCLVYDQPIPERGLLWKDLVA